VNKPSRHLAPARPADLPTQSRPPARQRCRRTSCLRVAPPWRAIPTSAGSSAHRAADEPARRKQAEPVSHGPRHRLSPREGGA
jgi:hypothetical protein